MKLHLLFLILFSQSLWAQIRTAEMDFTDPLQLETLAMIPIMEARIGRTLTIPVVVWTPRRQISDRLITISRSMEHAYAWTIPAFVGADGKWEEDGQAPSQHSCLIYYNPSGYLSTGAERASYIAHEIYHCFQFAQAGLGKVLEMPKWLIEGSAEFAGELFSEGSIHSEPLWMQYLTSRINISEVSYHALGLFATIHSKGMQNAFEVADQLLTSDHEQLWSKLGLVLSTEEKTSLASMSKMKNDWGENYFITFPQIPNGTEFPLEFMGDMLTPSTTQVDSAVLGHYQYTLPVNKIIKVSLMGEAYGRMRISKIDGTMVLDTEISEGQDLKICRGQLCGCANGNDAYDVIKLDDLALNVQFYVTAFLPLANLEFTEAEPGCCPGSLGVDARLVGTWKMDNDLLMTAMRPQPNLEDEHIRGEHIVRISSTGEISRTGHLKASYKWVKGRDRFKETRTMTSRVNGCIETRATGPNKGWLFHRELSERSRYSIVATFNDRRSVNTSITEEYPFIRWGTGTTGTNSIYEINGETLRIRGEPRTYLKISE
jgi:hypothetical protein